MIVALVIVAAWAVLTVLLTVVLSRVLGKPTPEQDASPLLAANAHPAGRQMTKDGTDAGGVGAPS